MISFILALVLLFIALLAIGLRKTYYAVPIKELKRQARRGDVLAKMLYRAVAYGASLSLLLWTVIVLSTAGSFVLLTLVAPALLAFVVIALAVAVGFAWLPATGLTKLSASLVIWATPAVAWSLNYLHPLLDRMTAFVHMHRPVTVHTGLYEREDLLTLLERQRQQPDSRLSTEELDLLAHALTFGEKMVGDIMVPRRIARLVSSDETVGPMLMKELHDSGHSRFPVYQDGKDRIIGTLYLRDLVDLKHTGQVRDIMEHAVYYAHEDYSLEQVLHAFLKTKHHLFIVVNSFEEFVGLVTIEDILEQILGCKIVDEFDNYDDLRAVATNHAHREHTEHTKSGKEAVAEAPEGKKKASSESTEVVQ